MDREERRAKWLTYGAMALAVGLLIWARLRLVTDLPRTVYAEPETQQIDDETRNDFAPTRRR